MNPDSNQFEQIFSDPDWSERIKNAMDAGISGLESLAGPSRLLRADGTPVPEHWSTFKVDEEVVIKNYTFRVKYIGETSILFEPVGPVVIGKK